VVPVEFRPSRIFIAIAVAFLFFGLTVGIFRLMSDNGIYTGILQNIYVLHPILMVFGFLACVVMAERVAGISIIQDLKQSRVPLVMVPLVTIGMLLELTEYTTGPTWLNYAGGAFLLAGCLAFIVVLMKLASKTGIKLPFYFMIVSAVSLSVSAILSALYLPLGNIPFIMLLLSFPMMLILGERVELTRFTASVSTTKRFRISFIFACASVALFTFSSALTRFSELQTMVLFVGTLFLLATLVTVLVAENFRLLSKSKETLQRYVFVHTRIAYAWGIFGLILAEIYFAYSFRFDLYDPFIHSIAVGFIGTMLLAHGPVILPSVLGRKLDVTRLSIFPLGILTTGNLIRVSGDLISVSYYSEMVTLFVGLSGWLILIALIVFIIELVHLNSTSTRSHVNLQKKIETGDQKNPVS
jgi:hypothetical protein